MTIKITLVASEFPYPPIHGGRVDTWRRICALHEQGVQIQLITWISKRKGKSPSADDIEEVKSKVSSLVLLPLPDTLIGRIVGVARAPFLPIPICQRVPAVNLMKETRRVVACFDPAVIVCDGLFGASLAGTLSAYTARPMVARSQNIEHRYMASQAGVAKPLIQKAKYYAFSVGLKRYEKSFLGRCAKVFDISVADLEHWRARGIMTGTWLPPFATCLDPAKLSEAAPKYDIAYLGNLHAPNNLAGIQWFVTRVVPLLNPDTKILIAGSDPSSHFRRICRSGGHITVLENPDSPDTVYREARVLVNPIFSGSGVNIKSVDMLASGRPVVTTAQGVMGLPTEISGLFLTAETEREFADRIVQALSDGAVVNEHSQDMAERFFGRSAVQQFVSQLTAIAEQSQQERGPYCR